MYEYHQFSPGPPDYRNITNALPARFQRNRERIPVRARLVWEHDGEEWVTGHALRLDANDGAIFVEFADPRHRFTGAWLRPDDVEWDGKNT